MNLKVDPKLPHHYIIGVAARTALSSKPGELYLKYGPVYFHNDDVVKVQDAKILSEDKLFKTSSSDALKIHDCTGIVHSIWALKMSSQVNECTVHHFSCAFICGDESFDIIVKTANYSKSSKELLDKSRI